MSQPEVEFGNNSLKLGKSKKVAWAGELGQFNDDLTFYEVKSVTGPGCARWWLLARLGKGDRWW